MPYLINTPTPFVPLERWHQFLKMLQGLDQSDVIVKSEIAHATAQIAEMEAESHLGAKTA